MILVFDEYHNPKCMFTTKHAKNDVPSTLKQEPMYDHWLMKKTQDSQPDRQSKMWPISTFWDISSTKAHCLLDNGCEGTMMSPSFTRATRLQVIPLEQPINLQLIVVGSHSIVNYGTSGQLKFGVNVLDEYFDITNINYYNITLGTLFLMKWGMSLDFSSQGGIMMEGRLIPQGGKPAEQAKTLNMIAPMLNTPPHNNMKEVILDLGDCQASHLVNRG
jgi:hypothetical protein